MTPIKMLSDCFEYFKVKYLTIIDKFISDSINETHKVVILNKFDMFFMSEVYL